jgi:hypothetical protein
MPARANGSSFLTRTAVGSWKAAVLLFGDKTMWTYKVNGTGAELYGADGSWCGIVVSVAIAKFLVKAANDAIEALQRGS